MGRGGLSLSLFPFIVASFHKDFPHVPSPSPLSVFELVTVPVLILTFPFYNRPFFTSKFRAKFWTRRFKRFALEEGIVCFRVGFACGYCTLISRQLSARINNTNEVIQFLRLCLKRRLLIFSFFFFIYSWNIIGNNFIFFFFNFLDSAANRAFYFLFIFNFRKKLFPIYFFQRQSGKTDVECGTIEQNVNQKRK